MKFMMIVRATEASESGVLPSEELIEQMTKYNEELTKAGVLLDLNGLHPSSKGKRIHYSAGKQTVIDGPFGATKELIAGYWLIQVKSPEEALQWALKIPAPFGKDADGEIELRQVFGPEDFGDSEAAKRSYELGRELTSKI